MHILCELHVAHKALNFKLETIQHSESLTFFDVYICNYRESFLPESNRSD